MAIILLKTVDGPQEKNKWQTEENQINAIEDTGGRRKTQWLLLAEDKI
jgi:hypothetical protein